MVLCLGGAILCRLTVSDQGHFADIDTTSSSNINKSVTDEDRVLEALLNHPEGGHPLSMITQQKDTDTSSESEISAAPDVESLISVSQTDFIPSESRASHSRPLGQASPQLYMICHVGVASHVLSAQHLIFSILKKDHTTVSTVLLTSIHIQISGPTFQISTK